jgi:mannose-1-phosphate guanylyltransferase
MDEGGHRWNSGQFAWKAETELGEINAYLPEASRLLVRIGEAWDTAERDRVLGELFPKMPKGSIDYKVMQTTSNACS